MEPRNVSTGVITKWGYAGNERLGHVLNHIVFTDLRAHVVRHLMKDMQQLIDRAVHDEAKEKGWP